MPADRDDFDDEIRGHLALSVKERIDRGGARVAGQRLTSPQVGIRIESYLWT
jgi:hypothetical protein